MKRVMYLKMLYSHPYSPFTETVGSKEEDRQMVQLLEEEQAQITQRIESLRKDVRTDIRHRTFYISALVSLEFDEKT